MFSKVLYLALFAVGVYSDGCFNVAYGPSGQCNSDPGSNANLEAYLIQDHAVPSCSAAATFTIRARYIDTSGVVHTESAIATRAINATFTGTVPFDFMVPLSAIRAKSPVTFNINATNSQLGVRHTTNIVYTQNHITTLGYYTKAVTVPFTVNATQSKISSHMKKRFPY